MVETQTDPGSLTFKEAMDELDGIVASLESNTLELEESLLRYERGVALLSSLQTRLTQARQQVDVLMGKLEETPEDEVNDTTLS